MEKKKVIQISLSTFLLILAIIAIIVMGLFIYKLNNDKIAEIQKSIKLQSQVTILTESVNELQGKINSISNTINANRTDTNNVSNNNNPNDSISSINYIDLNQSNYNKYPISRVSSISKNEDGTYTIISRVYDEVELPILSENEVTQLENGGTVKIFNWTLKKDDFEENVLTSIDENNWIKFNILKNANGTASLSIYGQFRLGKPSQIYMKAIVKESVLSTNISEYSSDIDDLNEFTLLTYSEHFEFTNGKISNFEFIYL